MNKLEDVLGKRLKKLLILAKISASISSLSCAYATIIWLNALNSDNAVLVLSLTLLMISSALVWVWNIFW